FECPYKEGFCKESAVSLSRLKWVYGRHIKVTLSEPTSSIVARSEHQYNKREYLRLSLRKHLYKVAGGEGAVFGMDCADVGESDRFATYLGFIDLRFHSIESPLALGILAPPKRLREDRSTNLVTGFYGPIFGGPGFECSVYSMQDPKSGGSYCAQICIFMILA